MNTDEEARQVYNDEKASFTVEAFISAVKEKRPLIQSPPKSVLQSGESGGLVYFAACRNFVKVGWSVNPRARIYTLQAGNPYQITIIGVLDGRAEQEAAIHRAMSRVRHNSEWHHMSDTLEQIIHHHTFNYHPTGRYWTIKQERDLRMQLRETMHTDTTPGPHTGNVVPLKKA